MEDSLAKSVDESHAASSLAWKQNKPAGQAHDISASELVGGQLKIRPDTRNPKPVTRNLLFAICPSFLRDRPRDYRSVPLNEFEVREATGPAMWHR